jgi:hypothetical protein
LVTGGSHAARIFLLEALMTQDAWPVDAIGNTIHKDDLVRVALQEAALIFQVTDIQAAGTLMGPDDKPLNLNGTITVSVSIPIQYQAGSLLGNMLVLQKPEPGPVN